MLILSLLHIVLGAFWAGAVLFAFAFLEPAVEAAGPAGGAFMQKLMSGRLPKVMPVVGALTILSGAVMYWMVSDRFSAAWIGSAHGIAISIGALAAIAGAVAGGPMSHPLRQRVLAIRGSLQGAAPSAEQQAELQSIAAALRVRSRASALFILLALTAMAAAHAL